MRIVTLAAVAGFVASAAAAADFKLPDQLVWTAYGTGSAGYNQAVAIGAALKERAGVNLRILPADNDVARMEPLRQGKVELSANGIGVGVAPIALIVSIHTGAPGVRMRTPSRSAGPATGLFVHSSRSPCHQLNDSTW